MDNFFEDYLEWIIEKYNDGENINDILDDLDGYTANTETYYCPECTYVLAGVETYLKFAEALGCVDTPIPVATDYKTLEILGPCDCCRSVNAGLEIYTNYILLFGEEADASPCCLSNNFCIESNFSPQNIANLLDKGIVEQGSSSEIYNTNLCYLFDRLIQEGYSESEVYDIVDAIQDNGIVIVCIENAIWGASVEVYLKYAEANGLTY